MIGTILGAIILGIGGRVAMRLVALDAGGLFWTAYLGLTLFGLRPVDVTRLIYFVPLVLVYGVALQLAWARLRRQAESG